MTSRDEITTRGASAPAPAAFAATVSVQALAPLVEALRLGQVDPGAFLRQYSIEHAQAEGSDERIPVARLAGIWSHAARVLEDPLLGFHAAARVEEHTFGLFSFLMALSDTWGQALARVCQYFRLMTDMGRYELSVSGDTAVLHFAASPGAAVSCELCDFLVAVPFTYGVRSVDGFCVQGVRLPYPAPQHRASLEPLFGVDVQFQAEAPALVFSARLLEAPLRGRAPRLSALLANLASERLAALPGVEEPLAQFRKALADALRAGDVSLGATARRLGTTPRSLQRRLSMQGTRYADELDRARREMALVLVTQPGLTFEQIAFLLCFSEAAPFQRAFRRWTGESPGRYRERHASASR